jgi:serine/threonine protein kinase
MHYPEPGEIFANKYRVEELLGSGGFSRVYRAVQVDLERDVAIKILRPPVHQLDSEIERQAKLDSLSVRFHREAKMISKLRSPNTIIMYDYGRLDESGMLYMVIEYVDGLNLTELIRHTGALSPERCVKIMTQILTSLHEAHLNGMLHRDIKPQNIMVYDHMGMTDQVKLLDFGIVKLMNDARMEGAKDLTDDGTLVGTPRYMAPEYIRGAEIGPASDIYALGLVFYELLMGVQAITVESSIQIIGKQLEREPFYLPPNAAIAPELRDIVNRMVEKNPARRYQSGQEIIDDLNRIQHLASTGYRVTPTPAPAPTPAELPELHLELTPEPFAAPQTDPSGPLVAAAPRASQNNTGEYTEQPDDSNTNRNLFIAVGVAALLVIILFGAVIATSGSKDDPAEGTGDAVAAKAQEGTSDEAAPADTPPPEAKKITVRVTTPVDGADIFVNNASKGISPLDVDLTGASFPVTIMARDAKTGASEKVTVSEYLAAKGVVAIPLDPAPAKAPEPVAEATPDPDPEVDPEPKKAPKVRAVKSDSKPKKKTSTKKPEKKDDPKPAEKPEKKKPVYGLPPI